MSLDWKNRNSLFTASYFYGVLNIPVWILLGSNLVIRLEKNCITHLHAMQNNNKLKETLCKVQQSKTYIICTHISTVFSFWKRKGDFQKVQNFHFLSIYQYWSTICSV